MKYNAPFGSSDPDAPYVDRNTPGAVSGSRVPAAAVEHPQRETVSLITLSGQTPSESDLQQLAKAVRSQAMNYVAAGGTANALTVTLTPAPATLAAMEGMPLRVKVGATNTGAGTLKVGALAAAPIVRANGAILFDGDLVSGGIYELVYDGTSFRAVTLTAPPVLIRPLTLYVNAATGNDANDGSANVSGKALASIQGAVDRAWSYGPGAYTVTILVAPGTHASVVVPPRPGPKLDIQGTGTNAADVNILASAGLDAFAVMGVGVVNVSKVKASNLVGYAGFVGYDQSTLLINNCESGSCSGAQVQAFGGAFVTCYNHRITGSTLASFRANVGGKLGLGGTVTVPSPITSSYFAVASNLGAITVSTSIPLSFTGAAVTGQRYNASTNGIIDTNGGGANFFPGSAAGAVGTGGQYV